MISPDIRSAIREAIRRAGSQAALARSVGMTQSRISDYLNERCEIGNITFATLLRLFPQIKIDFFADGKEQLKIRHIKGSQLEYCRKVSQITQEQLGQMLGGLLKEDISLWESNRRPIPIKYYSKLKKIFGVDIFYATSAYTQNQIGVEEYIVDCQCLSAKLRVELIRQYNASDAQSFKMYVINHVNINDETKVEILKKLKGKYTPVLTIFKMA